MNNDYTHWHLETGNPECPIECAGDIYGALELAAWWVDGEADYAHQSISSLGEAGMFEEAYEAWQRSEKLTCLLLNIRNITDHHYGRKDPAPLYRGPDAAERLRESAGRVADQLNDSSAGVAIYPAMFVAGECEQEDDE